MYYYRRRSGKKWIILLIVLILAGIGGYWYYQNYFKPIESPTANQTNPATSDVMAIYAVENEVLADLNNAGFIKVASGQQLKAGDKIKTGANSKAIILINNSVIRLDSNSQLNILLISADKTILEQVSGQSYHKVAANSTYTVKSLDSIITAVGTKFNVTTDEAKKIVNLTQIEGQVKLEVLKQSAVILSALVEKNENLAINLTAAKKDIFKFSENKLDDLKKDAWYSYNFTEDEKVYVVNNNQPEMVTPVKELELKIEATEEGNQLSWTTYSKNDFQIYKVVRSDTKENPIFPDDGYIYGSPDKDSGSYLDKDIIAAKNYFYTVCVLTNLNQVICGNSLSVKAAENEAEKNILQLSSTIENNQIKLTWNQYQDEDYMFFKVVRSETNADLRYPTDGYVKTIYEATETEYTDDKAESDKTYNYRICLKKKSDGKILCGSVVTVKAPASESAGDISLSATPKDSANYLSWNKIESDIFGSYKILRSETDSVLDFSSSKVINTINLNTVTSYTDSSADITKKYYYRVCYSLTDASQTCSNVVSVAARAEAVDAQPPSAPSLMGSVSDSGVSLNWTKNSETDFKEYRIVKSQTSSALTYPAFGSIGTRQKGSETYVDSSVTNTTAGTYYYRICALDNSGNVNCGNVVKVANGVIE